MRADVEAAKDPAVWNVHVRTTAEILARPQALLREIVLLSAPWGLELAQVRVPVAFWSGEYDRRHPTSQSRRLAALIGGDPTVSDAPGITAATIIAMPRR